MNMDPQADPTEWVERFGDLLYRFALARVEQPDVAADLVQDTLVDAWKNRARFAGRSALGTWLVGIMKHKISDYFRHRSVTQQACRVPLELLDEPTFTRKGFWKADLGRWPRDPSTTLMEQEFWQIFSTCVEALPQNLGEAFMLRELDGLSSEEICKLLGITATNLWARLHRARLQLRACLQQHWFHDD